MVKPAQMQHKPKVDAKNADDDVPRIAWSRLGIMDSLKLAEIENDQGEITILNRLLALGKLSDAQVERLLELQSMEHQWEQAQKRMEVMARYVEYVPRSWFVDDAGHMLDLDDPETFKLLRTDKFRVLYQMLMFGNQTSAQISGNSKAD